MCYGYAVLKFIRRHFVVLVLFVVFAEQGFAWPDLPPAISLPPIDTLQQQLSYLQWQETKSPGLFTYAATFDVDLLKLIKDNATLVGELVKIPGYVEAFRDRKYVNIKVTPKKGKIKVETYRVTFSALREWGHQLVGVLKDLGSGPLPQAIADRITANAQRLQEYENYLRERGQVKSLNASVLDLSRYFELLGFSAKNKSKDKADFLRMINKGAHSVLEKLNALHRVLQTHGLDPNNEMMIRLRDAISSTNTVEERKAHYAGDRQAFFEELLKKQVLLAELYGLLQKKTDGFAQFRGTEDERRRAEEDLKYLESDDLGFFEDEDFRQEVLKPLSARMKGADSIWATMHEFVTPSVKDRTQKYAAKHVVEGRLNLAQETFLAHIKYFAQQTRKHKTEAEEGIMLQEVEPRFGIVRGLVAGDCSTKFSFPYPNDPLERVFWILDAQGKPKGSVSTTLVDITDAHGKKSKGLYVITVAGATVTAGDTELVFRSLDREKHVFGADHLVLPQKKKLRNLINFGAIRGVYEDRINHQIYVLMDQQAIPREVAETALTVGVEYMGVCRPMIEAFKTHEYSGKYDHRSENRQGMLVNYSPEDLADDTFEVQVASANPVTMDLKSMSQDKMILFALEQNVAGREAMVQALIHDTALDEKIKSDLKNAVQVLKNQSAMDIERYEAKVKAAFLSLGLNTEGTEVYQSLFYRGRLKCPDAFSESAIERTARDLVRDIKLSQYQPKAGWEVVFENREALMKTAAFFSLHQKLMEQFRSSDEVMSAQAAYLLLTKIGPDSGGKDSDCFSLVERLEPFLDRTDPSDLFLIRSMVNRRIGAHWDKVKIRVNEASENEIVKTLDHSWQIFPIVLRLQSCGEIAEAKKLLEKFFELLKIRMNKPDEFSQHMVGQGMEALSKLTGLMTSENYELCKRAILLFYKNSLKNIIFMSPEAQFEDLRRIKDLGVRAEFIQVLVEGMRDNLRSHGGSSFWIHTVKFCDMLKLESDFESDLMGFCSDFKKEYPITQKKLSSASEVVELASFLFGQGGEVHLQEEANFIVRRLEEFVERDANDLDQAMYLLKIYQENPKIPGATSQIAMIWQKIEVDPQTDHLYSPSRWLPVAHFFEPEFDAAKNSKIMASLEEALLSILEEQNPSDFTENILNEFRQLHWSRKYPDIDHILGISDKAERKKYIYEHYGQGRDMTPKQKALHESPVLLGYKDFLKREPMKFPFNFPAGYFHELRRIKDMSIRPELIRLLIEHHQEKLREARSCRCASGWVDVAQFCARAKLELEFAEDLSAFCSTLGGKYALTRKMVSGLCWSLEKISDFLFRERGAENWPAEAALVVSVLEEHVNKRAEDLDLDQAVSLLKIYQRNSVIPHAKSHIATIRSKIENAPQIDHIYSFDNWMFLAQFFEPEFDVPKNSKIMRAFEKEMFTILENGEPAHLNKYVMDMFLNSHWSKKCPDIDHILGISDKAERKRYIDEHYRQKSVNIEDPGFNSQMQHEAA